MPEQDGRNETRGGGVAVATTLSDGDPARETDALTDTYDFREPAEVRSFLIANPDLLPLVREAATVVSTFLRPSGRLVLEVFRSYEDDKDEALLVVVVVPSTEGSVLSSLNRLTSEWLAGTDRSAAGRFNVIAEYH